MNNDVIVMYDVSYYFLSFVVCFDDILTVKVDTSTRIHPFILTPDAHDHTPSHDLSKIKTHKKQRKSFFHSLLFYAKKVRGVRMNMYLIIVLPFP